MNDRPVWPEWQRPDAHVGPPPPLWHTPNDPANPYAAYAYSVPDPTVRRLRRGSKRPRQLAALVACLAVVGVYWALQGKRAGDSIDAKPTCQQIADGAARVLRGGSVTAVVTGGDAPADVPVAPLGAVTVCTIVATVVNTEFSFYFRVYGAGTDLAAYRATFADGDYKNRSVPASATPGASAVQAFTDPHSPGRVILFLTIDEYTAVAVSTVDPSEHAAVRDAAGTVIQAGLVDPWSLHVGDCVKVPTTISGLLLVLTVVPCRDIHNGQVFTILRAPNGAYPGEAVEQRRALDDCRSAVPSYLGQHYTALHVVTFYPRYGDWQDGGRSETCLLVDRAKQITGDIRADH